MAKLSEKKLEQIGKNFNKTKKIIKYLNKVFKFKDIIKNQKDYRKKRHFSTEIIFIILFWAFFLE